jgi:hypothetical protein
MNKKKSGRKRKRDRRGEVRPELCFDFPLHQRIWWEALHDLRNELFAQCLNAKADKLRFQNGRLLRNVLTRIDAVERPRQVETMWLCYWLMVRPDMPLGYDEPRRLHLEERNALGITPATRTHPIREKDVYPMTLERELLSCVFLLESIASWIEA